MVKRLTGLNPLAYMGVEPLTPSQFVQEPRNPTTNDYDGFNLMAVWLNTTTFQVWMLVSKANFVATWQQFTSAAGAVNTLTADTGTNPVPPTAGNINLFGGTGIGTVGNAAGSTITINADASVATQYDTDLGTAIPVGNTLNIVGGGAHVTTTGAGNTVTISAAGTIAVQVDTDAGSAVPSGGVLNALGGNNISTSAVGDTVTIDVTGTTNHALQRGNATGSLTSLAVGTDGQVVIGATGADPAFATLTSAGGTILFTPGPNTLNLESGASPVDIVTDAGTATVAAGILNVVGLAGGSISTSGAGNTVSVTVSGTTQYAPQMGNAAGSLDDIGVMTDGELIIGVTGSAPNLARLTAGTGISIDDSSTPGEITIAATGSATSGTKITTFNSSGTWTKDANSKMVTFMCCSGGGGGGSGKVTPGDSGTNGGQGGSARGMAYYVMPASFLPASTSITVGAGGAGGIGVSGPGTVNGNDGGDSGISYFEDVPGGLEYVNNWQGSGGGNAYTSGVFGYSTYNFSVHSGTNPGLISRTAFPILDTLAFGAPTSAGSGGVISSSGTPSAGNDGGVVAIVGSSSTVGSAAAGGAVGVNGAAGADAGTQTTGWMVLGYGGGGGGAHATNPGDGGQGGFPGGGGGGGGATTSGTSGAGGAGGDGQVIVIEYLGA